MSEHTQAVWEEVRRRKEFTAGEIAEALDLPRAVTCDLLWGFSSSGCVSHHGKSDSAALCADTRWSLVDDIGPLAPRRIMVSFSFDPNSGQIASGNDKALSFNMDALHRLLLELGGSALILNAVRRENMPAPPLPAEEVVSMERMMVRL